MKIEVCIHAPFQGKAFFHFFTDILIINGVFLTSFFNVETTQKTLVKEYTFFYKKLGSGHSTKSFLIQQEILSILVLKVS